VAPKPAAKPAAPALPPKPEPGPLGQQVRDQGRDLFEGPGTQKNHPQLLVKPARIQDALALAKRVGFEHLANLTAVDVCPPGIIPLPPGAKEPTVVFGGEPRIEVVYNLYSYRGKEHLSFKVKLPRDAPALPTACPVYAGANWLEREVWDLMGVRFDGHPDPKRLLLPEGWAGHPLRKDYDRTKEQYVGLDEETGEDVVSFEEGRGW
jgi:NADH-quinone oxidoreductase subunit C